MEHQKRKVLLIGWDAADWKVINPLMDEGKMPNLERLVNGGTMGNLATLTPVLSPMLWTSIATGKRPFKHGIHGFTEPDPDRGGVRPITNLSRKTKAIWNILSQLGLKSNVIGWWPSHPAEPINGAMVSNHFHKAKGPSPDNWPIPEGAVSPPERSQVLAQFRVHLSELDAGQLLPFVPRGAEVDIKKDRRLEQVARILAECASVHACATAVMQNERWDFMGIYYDAIDHFCHGFMRYHPPRQEHIDEESYELYKGVVEAAYRFHDMMLGVTWQLAGEDATVILISDHGFHPDHNRPKRIPTEPNGPAVEHSHLGVFVANGPGIKKDGTVFGANLLDVTPTILGLFGLPVGEDMDGRVITGIFETPPEIAAIPSWDEVEGEDGRHPPHVQYCPGDDHDLMNQLVELGYVEAIDEDRELAQRKSLRELDFNLARSYIDADRHLESIPILEKLVEDWPTEFRFLNQLAYSYLSVEKVGEARRCAELILGAQERTRKRVRKEMQQLQESLGETAEEDYSRETWTRIMQLNSDLEQARMPQHLLFGNILMAEGKAEEALEVLSLIPEQAWTTPFLPMRLGAVCLRLGRLDEAEGYFEKAIEMDPQNPKAHQLLMNLSSKKRDFQRAAEFGLKAVGLRYFFPAAHHQLGRALVRLGKHEEAVNAFQVALSQLPVFLEAHQDLAEVYRRYLGKPVQADEHFRRANEIIQQRARKTKETKAVDQPVVSVSISSRPQLPRDWNEEKVITVVSGLPRSGTSMMMQMLQASGMACLTDGIREADENNPEGFFELEEVKELARKNEFLQRATGRAVKIVAPLLTHLPLDSGLRYRVIFLERDLDEVMASQAAMLTRLDRPVSKASVTDLRQSYLRLLGRVDAFLESHRIPTLVVNHRETLDRPEESSRRVNGFCPAIVWKSSMARSGFKSNIFPEPNSSQTLPSLVMASPFLAEIRMVGFNFSPRGWALCDGQLLPINQNQSLFSLLGTTYGGDGRTSFALLDLRGRSPRKGGQSAADIGQRAGTETVTLTEAEIPAHSHSFQVNAQASNASTPEGNYLGKDTDPPIYREVGKSTVPMEPGTIAATGGGLSHENMQPYQVVNFCIALQGLLPSRN